MKITSATLLFLTGILLAPGYLQAQHDGDLPLVKIIATGGTIANSPDGRMAVDTVLAQIPEISAIADIDVYDYSRIGSSEISVQNWIDIARVITNELNSNPRINGIVVTHGSNTSEETAYFLNLLLKTERPVIVVGAQRQRNTLSEDGSRNLYDAIRVAAHPEAAGRGVMLVVGEMIHAARDVTKTISYRPETWSSGDLGVLGLTDTDMIRFYRMPSTRHTMNSEFQLEKLNNADDMPYVEILYTYAGAGDQLVDAAVASGAKGIVVAAFPTGSPTPAMEEALMRAHKNGVPVVTSHRGGRGRIQTNREFISADNLTPHKARILLMLALAHDITDEDRLEEIFMNY